MFEEAGMLAGLYTDSSAYSPAGRVASGLIHVGMDFPKLAALASRKPNGIPKAKVFSYDNFLVSRRGGHLPEKFKRRGLQGANVIYNTCGEFPEFLLWAKGRGLKLVIDIFVHPGTERIVEEESVRYQGRSQKGAAFVESVETYFRKTFEMADIILCPSSWVADGVREYAPEYSSKIRLVPYGSSLKISSSINRNVLKGRVLFAGREALRKGVHYLAEAAHLVRAQGFEIDVRVAGLHANEVTRIKYADELNFLGVLPMESMGDEFRQADVFVLPSLSEGQASVILEAMACGCPVISTRESGVDLDPESGILVPARNAEALAQAVIDVIADRDGRNRFAEGALRQAKNFSMAKWRERLVDVVEEAVGS